MAKFADHLPLYRQEKIFGRAGLAIARSTLAQWVGQDGMQLQPLADALREAVIAQRVGPLEQAVTSDFQQQSTFDEEGC